MNKIPNRNDPCPCGSGKKYKKCCGFKMEVQKQIKAKVLAQGPMAALFGKAASGLASDFFKQMKVTQIKSPESKTALDRMKENNNKSVESNDQV